MTKNKSMTKNSFILELYHDFVKVIQPVYIANRTYRTWFWWKYSIMLVKKRDQGELEILFSFNFLMFTFTNIVD